MSQDPYKILGVSRVATDAEIKAEYRKLAKKYHPDLKPDDADNAQKFKEISAAYDNIKDAEARRKYQSDDTVNNFHKNYQNRQRQGGFNSDFAFNNLGGWDNIFKQSQFYGDDDVPSGPYRRDVTYGVEIEFEEAVLGTQKHITREDGQKVKVTIPAGTQAGTKLRLRGQGKHGGDSYVEIFVKENKHFRLEGRNVVADLPITIDEAILGGKVKVETLTGTVELMVPAFSSSGNRLRLKGRGVAATEKELAGDLMLILQIVLPEIGDSELKRAIEDWRRKSGGYTPKHR